MADSCERDLQCRDVGVYVQVHAISAHEERLTFG